MWPLSIPRQRNNPPVRLASGSFLRVRGRLQRKPRGLSLGSLPTKWGGGFAGKYLLTMPVEPQNDNKGQFEVVLPIEKFQREKEVFQPSLLGLQMVDFWALTVTENLGLEIIEVELSK